MPKKLGGGNKLQEYKKKDGEYTFNDGGETTTELSNKLKQEIKKDDYIEDNKSIKNDYIRKSIEVNHIQYENVDRLTKPLTEEEIINKIGGEDKTKGSCASLSFAFVGNMAGLDVMDYRGGISRSIFSRMFLIKQLSQLQGVNSFIDKSYSDITSLYNLAQKMEENKLYILAIGDHASIVRKKNGHYEYLELQKRKKDNGFKPLTLEIAKNRFKATKSHYLYGKKYERDSILIECDSLKNNSDFINMLPYINNQKRRK